MVMAADLFECFLHAWNKYYN